MQILSIFLEHIKSILDCINASGITEEIERNTGVQLIKERGPRRVPSK